MTRRKAIRLLRTSREIVALDMRSYLLLLALSIELSGKDLTRPLAKNCDGVLND